VVIGSPIPRAWSVSPATIAGVTLKIMMNSAEVVAGEMQTDQAQWSVVRGPYGDPVAVIASTRL